MTSTNGTVDFESLYACTWDTISFGRHPVKAVGYDASGAMFSDEIFAWKFF